MTIQVYYTAVSDISGATIIITRFCFSIVKRVTRTRHNVTLKLRIFWNFLSVTVTWDLTSCSSAEEELVRSLSKPVYGSRHYVLFLACHIFGG
jgi:hypothetical protein